MCLRNFSPISLKLWPVDAFKNSKNVILTPLRLRPGAPMGPGSKIFFAYFFLGLGHDSQKFANRYLEKKFGGKFAPGGSDPQNFCQSDCVPPRAMCLFNFSPISLKLCPVDVRETRGGQK